MNKHIISAAGACVLAAVASADTVTARYQGAYSQSVDITYLGNPNGSQATVLFNWTRQDTPGPGIDTTLPNQFKGYCVELGQNVSGNTDYTYQVLTPAMAGYNATQELYLSRLWASYLPGIDSSTESGAFQMAVWELAFDAGVIDLSAGNFEGHGPAAVHSLASAWLSNVSSGGYAGGAASISILHNDSAQDMLVPTPGSLALLGMGGLLMRRRKR